MFFNNYSKTILKRYSVYDENQLVRLYMIDNDERAMYALIVRYEKRLWSCFYKDLLDAHASEDLIQETYEQVLKSKAFNEVNIKHFERYLFRTAHNIKCHYINKRQKRRSYIANSYFDNQEKGKDGIFRSSHKYRHSQSEETTTPYEEDEMILLLEKAIKQLTPIQRKAINLQLEGHNQSEIADKMNIKPNNVSSIIYRAKENLRKKLKGV